MDIAFVLYDQMTALDLVGPYEVLASGPDVTPHFVASRRGPVRCDAGLVLEPTVTFDELPAADVVVVPGSSQFRAALDSGPLLAWLAAAHRTATWTASVCTAATLLAKAGILTGRPATTHWAVREVLAAHGAIVRTERVVIDGDVITAAGVSAGIDMALTLAALLWDERTARMLQLGLEYDPRPPFDAGSPDKAALEDVAALRGLLAAAPA